MLQLLASDSSWAEEEELMQSSEPSLGKRRRLLDADFCLATRERGKRQTHTFSGYLATDSQTARQTARQTASLPPSTSSNVGLISLAELSWRLAPSPVANQQRLYLHLSFTSQEESLPVFSGQVQPSLDSGCCSEPGPTELF